MTVPSEYTQASAKLNEYLVDARDTAGLWSTHVTYTMTQGVFQTFRSRLSPEEIIVFANVLPVCLRALFIDDWSFDEERKSFESFEIMTHEVKQLRAAHNFSTNSAIKDVAQALRRHVDEDRFDKVLKQLPQGAIEFWES